MMYKGKSYIVEEEIPRNSVMVNNFKDYVSSLQSTIDVDTALNALYTYDWDILGDLGISQEDLKKTNEWKSVRLNTFHDYLLAVSTVINK